jgi:hypothetical protein
VIDDESIPTPSATKTSSRWVVLKSFGMSNTIHDALPAVAFLQRDLTMIAARKWLATSDRAWFRGDLVAGVTLAAYLLPAALGDASLAGLPPQAGLYACLFSGLVSNRPSYRRPILATMPTRPQPRYTRGVSTSLDAFERRVAA